MNSNFKKWIGILLMVLFVFSLAGCQKPPSGDGEEENPPGQDNTNKPGEPSEPQEKEKNGTYPFMEQLNENKQRLLYAMAMTEDRLLLLVTTDEDFSMAEEYQIYTYCLSDETLSDTGINGVTQTSDLVQSPAGDHVAVVSRNSDMVPASVALIPIAGGKAEVIALPEPTELFQVAVSPDLQHIIYTTEDGITLCDGSFENGEIILERYVDPVDAVGDELPVGGVFIDNERFLYSISGYEWRCGTGIYNIKTGENQYTESLMDTVSVVLKDERVFWYSSYTAMPAGFYDFSKGDDGKQEVFSEELAYGSADGNEAEWNEIRGIVISPSGNRIAYHGVITDDAVKQVQMVHVRDIATGELIASYERQPDDDYQYLDQICFVSEDEILLRTCRTVNVLSTAEFWRFGE